MFVNTENPWNVSGGYGLCKNCVLVNLKSNPKFINSREETNISTFKCPAKKCSSTSLSFTEFVGGKCCHDGSVKAFELYSTEIIDYIGTTTDKQNVYEKLNLVQTVISGASVKKSNALKSVVESRMQEKEAQEKLISAKKNAIAAVKNYNDTKEILLKMDTFVDSTVEIINSLVAKTSKRNSKSKKEL